VRIPYEAIKDPRGMGYLAGAAVTFTIAGALLLSTVRRYLHEWTVADAVRAFHQDDGAAAQVFGALRTERPTDPLPRLFLGAWEADRADIDPGRLELPGLVEQPLGHLEPGSRPAAIGRLVVKLRAAAARPAAQRASAASHAEELLRDLDPAHPDVLPLRAALEVLRKRPDEARKLLEAPPKEVPSLQPYGAWMWNRAVARMLCRDGRALDDALLAHQLRQWPDPAPVEVVPGEPPPPPGPRADGARLLTLAYRLALADPAAQGAKDFAARCLRAQRALGTGRYIPSSPADRASALNALGIGFMKLNRPADAVAAFLEATQAVPQEPAYMFNLAAAYRLQGESSPEESQERVQAFMASGEAYNAVANYLNEDEARMKGREETFYLALQNACSAFIQGGAMDNAKRCYFSLHDKVPNEAQRSRDLGAVFDWANDRAAAIDYYKKAIELGHKEAGAMRNRLRVIEAGQ
jgi:tetratricopeptide (TPR) repeat protein